MLNRSLQILAAAALLAGCAGGAPPEPEPMKAQLIAGDMLNPDRSGDSKPVVVRIYQLKTGGTFETADFFSLYRNADAVLAADLLASREVVVQPGTTQKIEAEFDPATRVIGVVAAFRDIENAQWRASVKLPEEKLIKWLDRRQMLVNLEDRAVTLQFAKPPK